MKQNRTFHITTFGCQMNEHDSEIMAGLLIENGYVQASSRDEADIVIFNTCSIRAQERTGKGKLYRMRMRLHDAAAAHYRHLKGQIPLGGCCVRHP